MTGANVEFIFEDVLEIDLPKWKVVSNLPYSISSQITFKLLENRNSGVLCFQQEFAQRMFAKPGEKNWSRLSVNCQLLSAVDRLFNIPRAAFWPQPKVDSTVVRLTPKTPPEDWEKIKQLVDKIFLYPNKTIGKVEKITGIKFPASMAQKRVRELDLNQLVVAVKLIK